MLLLLIEVLYRYKKLFHLLGICKKWRHRASARRVAGQPCTPSQHLCHHSVYIFCHFTDWLGKAVNTWTFFFISFDIVSINVFLWFYLLQNFDSCYNISLLIKHTRLLYLIVHCMFYFMFIYLSLRTTCATGTLNTSSESTEPISNLFPNGRETTSRKRLDYSKLLNSCLNDTNEPKPVADQRGLRLLRACDKDKEKGRKCCKVDEIK